MPWLLNDYNSIFDFNVGMITKKESKDNKSKAMNNGYVFEIEQPTVNASVNTVDTIFKNNFRDLNYPISVQTSDKRNSAISRYRESKEEKKICMSFRQFLFNIIIYILLPNANATIYGLFNSFTKRCTRKHKSNVLFNSGHTRGS